MKRRVVRGRWQLLCVAGLALLWSGVSAAAQQRPQQIRGFRITILSTMLVGDAVGIGEWGFAALVEADGHRVLVDTGAHPNTVLENARDLHIDLSGVEEVVLTHNHPDHVSGLLTLRREMMKKNPKALSVVHVAEGIFNSRPSADGEKNPMLAIRKEFEATGGKRPFPEHNWGRLGRVETAAGLVEDTVPEDQSLVLDTPKGLVVITGCGHAGIVNIVTFAEKHFDDQPIYGIVGGLHLYASTDEQVDWTAGKLRAYRVANLLAAHCTGIEATYRLRKDLELSRATAVVASVGSSFSLEGGIAAGALAK
jgi:7,8-dihydropterin-6-yl-methyl-4-(beta-D-ribofuranosyl)aminobenzene 5'-phosphate synthase